MGTDYRSNQAWANAPKRPAAPRPGGGLSNEHIGRPYLYLLGSAPGGAPGANYIVTTTLPGVMLDPVNLVGVVSCTGRPMEIEFTGVIALGSAGALIGECLIDGRRTTNPQGGWLSDPQRILLADGTATGNGLLMTGTQKIFGLTRGDHTFAMSAWVTSGSASIYADRAVNPCRFTVKEG